MGRGTIIAKKKVGNIGAIRDKYEYTRRNNMEKAQMNLDKIFISKFKNIRFADICRKLNIDPKNASALRLNARDTHRIKVELDRLIREMYDIKNYKDYDLSKNYSYQRWDKQRNKEIENGDRILLRESCYPELTDE